MTPSEATPRSLTQMLRDFDDDSLADLLRARPDLADPEPASFSQVASRATTRESVRRALDTLNALELWVAAVAAAAPGPLADSDVPGVEPATAGAALGRLRALGLLWGRPDELRAVRALAGELGGASIGAPPDLDPPTVHHSEPQDPERVDQVAAGSAFELVRRIEVLVEHTDHSPLHLRQDGGLPQREARVVAALLDLPGPIATLPVQVAQAAGLIGLTPMTRVDNLLPTVAGDTWRGQQLADQWVWLARAWTQAHPPSGGAAMKALVLRAFGRPGQGRVVDAADLQRWLAWHRPRLADEWARRIPTLLTQAAWVGVTGLGALSSFGLLDDLAALERRLPAREDKVLLQNDLTAVAPGPLTPYAAKELGALADIESRGGATVYRFTVESLRRAHAAGWTSAQITTALQARSRTPIPQPLSYLIADLDRSRAVAAIMSPASLGRPSARHPTLRARATPLLGAESERGVDEDAVWRIVHGLRRSVGPERQERSADAPAAEPMADSPLETLREAVETGELVWVGYVDGAGTLTERLLYATAVEEGRLVGRSSRTGDAVTLSVHRINAAHIIRGGSV